VKVDFVPQSVSLVGSYGGDDSIESAARTCTQTQSKGDPTGFVKGLMRRRHMSSDEFGFADFQMVIDRAIQQELTRHRHLSFNIESTRWVGYDKRGFTFIADPVDGWDVPDEAVELLKRHCEECAEVYMRLIELGAPRDYARKALPLATASTVRSAGNFRAWFEMLEKRIGKTVHPEFNALSTGLRDILSKVSPGMFEDMGK